MPKAMVKPKIGVMPLWDDEKTSIWMLPGYMDGIIQAGGTPIIFPFLSDKTEIQGLAEMCDGFLLTGGHDVSPDLYNEDKLNGLTLCCEKRDFLESVILDYAVDTDKPLLGICRGIQFINAKLGGTLYQDIQLQHPSDIEHHQSAPYDIPVHKVKVEMDTPLFELLKNEYIDVNSYHHQAVNIVAPELEIMATAPDGLTEALYLTSHRFLWAVQWHPEFSFKSDENSRKIFKAFIDAARLL